MEFLPWVRQKRWKIYAGQVIERNGVKFGFLAYTYDANNGNYKDVEPRIAVLDVNQMRTDVAAMKARADVILVSMHAGTEYQLKPNAQQVEFARAAIDAAQEPSSATIPTCDSRGMVWRRGNLYSLGNLVFDQFQRTETQIGSLAELVFEGTQLVQARTRTVNLVLTVPKLEEYAGAGQSTGKQ